jgi:hypothetical protein
VNRRVYDVISEPRGETYRRLLTVARTRTNTFTLVVRSFDTLRETAQGVLDRLNGSLVKSGEEEEWPGTRLLRGTATIRRYSVNDLTIATLSTAVEGLFDWLEPDYPEDLSFYREAEPWLVTISHERDAYLTLSYEEAEQLRKQIPQLAMASESRGDGSVG